MTWNVLCLPDRLVIARDFSKIRLGSFVLLILALAGLVSVLQSTTPTADDRITASRFVVFFGLASLAAWGMFWRKTYGKTSGTCVEEYGLHVGLWSPKRSRTKQLGAPRRVLLKRVRRKISSTAGRPRQTSYPIILVHGGGYFKVLEIASQQSACRVAMMLADFLGVELVDDRAVINKWDR